MHFGIDEIRFRSTFVDPNAFLTLSNALALGACRAKCFSGMLKCALARRPSIQMRLRSAEMRSRSTPDDPNAFLIRSNALSLDACRSKCVSYVLRYALARRLSTQMLVESVERRSRPTPVDPNAFPVRSNALSFDACRSKCSKTNVIETEHFKIETEHFKIEAEHFKTEAGLPCPPCLLWKFLL